MPEVQHRTLGPGSNHVNHDYVVASAAARLALTVTEPDVGKDCMQTDTSPPTFWRLARVDGGLAWVQLAGSGVVLGVAGGAAGTSAIDSVAGNKGDDEEAARVDHTHWHGYLVGGALHAVATTSVAGFLSAADKAKLDGITPGAGAATPLATPTNSGTGTVAVAASGSTGDSTEAARKNHTNAHGDQVGGTMHAVATTATAGFMSASDKAKLDGVSEGAGAGTPLAPMDTAAGTTPIALTSSTGSSGNAARQDHTHSHGAHLGGILHSAASTSAAGFMSASDKSKLDGIAAGATATAPGTPVAVGTANSVGTGTYYALATHVHDASHLAPKLYEFVSNGAATLQIALAHLNKCILCTQTSGSPKIIIPRDSTLNLPVGFTCQIMSDVVGVSPEWHVRIESEVMTGYLGIPARHAENMMYSDTTQETWTTVMTLVRMVTLIKFGADKWFISGHHYAAA